MDDVTAAFARLAGIRTGAQALLGTTWGHGQVVTRFEQFPPNQAGDYFHRCQRPFQTLREQLPALYDDLPQIATDGDVAMGHPGQAAPAYYSRAQVEGLIRTIDQIFETRANSELATPASKPEPRVFISHGRSLDWTKVQPYIERDLKVRTLELAQEPNMGRSVLGKLDEETRKCTYAVIVMTGDDTNADGQLVARQNVLHEIGFLQARLGLSAVCLLHEEGTELFSNIHGLVYVPFPKGTVEATFGIILRELKAAGVIRT
jgi:predicted nucleotide-binding protein